MKGFITITLFSMIFSSTIYPEGCTEYRDEIGCTKCDKNYILKNNECFKTEGCLSKNDYECTSCSYGYYLFENLCYKKEENCLRAQII